MMKQILAAGGKPQPKQYAFIAHDNDAAQTWRYASYIEIDGSGFVSNLSALLSNPGSKPLCFAVSFEHNILAVGFDVAPYLRVYDISDFPPGSLSDSTDKYADPASAPSGAVYTVAIHPDGTAIAASGLTTPYIEAWEWTPSGFGSKFSNPSTLPGSGYPRSLDWTPDGNALVDARQNSPNGKVYAWSGSGFGSVIESFGTGTCFGAAVSRDGSKFAYNSNFDPLLLAYDFDSSTGFTSSQYPVYATAVNPFARYPEFHPSGDYILAGGSSSSGVDAAVFVYPIDGVTGISSPVATPASMRDDIPGIVRFSPAGDAIVYIDTSASPMVYMHPFDAATGTIGEQLPDYTDPIGFSNAGFITVAQKEF